MPVDLEPVHVIDLDDLNRVLELIHWTLLTVLLDAFFWDVYREVLERRLVYSTIVRCRLLQQVFELSSAIEHA